jgi:F0F1-type ATP synthase assembly protein I
MKLLPTNPRVTTSPNDSLGLGMDAALAVLLFFGIGYALDRWLGTTPWFMIGMVLLAAVGFFLKFKYRYDLEMSKLEAEHAARRNGEGPGPR